MCEGHTSGLSNIVLFKEGLPSQCAAERDSFNLLTITLLLRLKIIFSNFEILLPNYKMEHAYRYIIKFILDKLSSVRYIFSMYYIDPIEYSRIF